MRYASHVRPLKVHTDASSAVTNTVAETTVATYTFPANTLKAGETIEFEACGIATATNATDTLTMLVKLGSTTVYNSGALDVANNDVFYSKGSIVVRTVGASGTMVACGVGNIGVEGTVSAEPFLMDSATLDTTADKALTVTLTWSVASASNSARLDVFKCNKTVTPN